MAEFFSQGALNLIGYVAAHAKRHLTNGGGERWFQRYCADNIGINDTYLTHLMRGRKRPSLDKAFEIERLGESLLSENDISTKLKTHLDRAVDLMLDEGITHIQLDEGGISKVRQGVVMPAAHWTIAVSAAKVRRALSSAQKIIASAKELR